MRVVHLAVHFGSDFSHHRTASFPLTIDIEHRHLSLSDNSGIMATNHAALEVVLKTDNIAHVSIPLDDAYH